MSVNVIIPKLGLTMEKGTIVKWLKMEGEQITEGEPLVEITTDKVTYRVDSPASGRIVRVLYPENTEVDVAKTIAIIE